MAGVPSLRLCGLSVWIYTIVLIGTVGCPPVGVCSGEDESPEPKEPLQTRSSGPEGERKGEVKGQDEGESLFLSPAGMVTNVTSYKTACWVCGLGPVGVVKGFPWG
jgi:hypothetical protein